MARIRLAPELTYAVTRSSTIERRAPCARGGFAWAFGRPEIRPLLRRDARSVEALVAVLAGTGFGDPAVVSALTSGSGPR